MNTSSLVRVCVIAGVAAINTATSLMAGSTGNVAEGGRLARMWCAECHLVGAGDTRGSDSAPGLKSLADDPKISADMLRGFLQHPQQPMLPLELSRQQIDDLVAYIEALAND